MSVMTVLSTKTLQIYQFQTYVHQGNFFLCGI